MTTRNLSVLCQPFHLKIIRQVTAPCIYSSVPNFVATCNQMQIALPSAPQCTVHQKCLSPQAASSSITPCCSLLYTHSKHFTCMAYISDMPSSAGATLATHVQLCGASCSMAEARPRKRGGGALQSWQGPHWDPGVCIPSICGEYAANQQSCHLLHSLHLLL